MTGDQWHYTDFLDHDPDDYLHLDDLDELPIESDTELSDQLDHQIGVGDRLRRTIREVDGIDAREHPILVEQMRLHGHVGELCYALAERPDIDRDTLLDHVHQVSRMQVSQSLLLVELLHVVAKADIDPAALRDPEHADLDHAAE